MGGVSAESECEVRVEWTFRESAYGRFIELMGHVGGS